MGEENNQTEEIKTISFEEILNNFLKLPVLSIAMDGIFTEEKFLSELPSYIRKIEYKHGLNMEGKYQGQPFSLYISNIASRDYVYNTLNLPLQGVVYHQKMKGDEGPAFALVYPKMEPEERDEERQETINDLFIQQQGRIFLETDTDIDKENLEKIQDFYNFLTPMAGFYHWILRDNMRRLFDTQSSGSLDTLIVPKSD